MQQISIHLWFDKQAKEASDLYINLFKKVFSSSTALTKVNSVTQINGTPSGAMDIVNLHLLGTEFTLFSAGPTFKFNPSISMMVTCETKAQVQELWDTLSDGGKVLMELGEYPFSPFYGWTEDRYGVSWQVMLIGDLPLEVSVTPTMLFVGDVYGRVEEAVKFYASVFPNTHVGEFSRYAAGEGIDKPGMVKYVGFSILGQGFAAMESGEKHEFHFNEAVSIMVKCRDQSEIDYYWEKLSSSPENEQCGWLKDKFGISWQIAPAELETMMTEGTPEQVQRVTEAFMPMKKLDLEKLREAYKG